MAINRTSFSSVDFVGERHWEGSTPRSPRSASFGGVERIRSSSFDGFNSKNFIDATFKYPEWNASSLGINRIGKLAILAAKRGFMVVDFDYPNKPKKYLCNFKWEPGSLEWNPHHANDDLFASVMNQKVDIWDINSIQNSSNPQSTLSGHTRAISNMNWNYFDPNSLLTCSMDTYINLWDIRKNKRPASTFTTVAGSSQVKWNRKNTNLFGSAHDGDIRIWDIRKGNAPLVYIAGHLARIHAFDWCPHKEEFFVTASQDSTVKVWNMKTPKQSWASINNGAPVWKAKYTPFGNGLVTILVPQLRRTENSMFLWNMSDFKTPVNKFVGHEDVVLEFHWRSQRKDEHEEHQLVSWSKDQTLRLWRASKKTTQSITGEAYTRLSEEALDGSLLSIDNSHFEERKKPKNHVRSPDSPPMMSSTYKDPSTFNENVNNIKLEVERKPLDRPEKLDLVGLNLMDTKPYVQSPLSPGRLMSPMSRGRGYHGNNTSFSPDGNGAGGYMTPTQVLHQEFTLLNVNSPYFKIEKKDSEARLCIIAVRTQYIFFKLHVTFPMAYPDKDPPVFQFSKDSQIGDASKQKIVNALREISNSHVHRNRPCLEACLRRLRYVIEDIEETTSQLSGESPSVPRPGSYDNGGEVGHDMTDSTVPFPRTCGARFCSVGDKLVVFSRPEKYNNIFVAERSLRSMSALNAYLQTNSNDVFDNSGENQLGTLRKKPKAIGLVYISNTSLLIPVSKELAQNYVLHGDDPSALCLRNAELADKVMRKDLVQTWTLLSKVLSKEVGPESSTSFEKVPWACHPFGRKLINSLFYYYERLKDVQTLAIMSCLLAKQHLPEDIQELSKINKIIEEEEDNKPPTRPSTRFSNPDSFQVSPEFSPYDVYNRPSVGQDDSPLNFAPEEKSYDPEEELRKQHSENCRLLNPKETFRYDQFKRNYSEILYRWDMQAQRTEVMKFCTEQHEEKRIMDITLDCTSCNTQRNNPCCAKCKSFIVKCSVCRIGVRGLLSFCMTCGHGGHMYHLIDWFKQNEWCATGCGCYCLRSGLASAPYTT